ncbi:response regulator [Cerasicoccus fimbriatus]|uniref:response regulator n=1 Tax=Cerasicoccus fimbriatus TaxID=3014554 RepID=UPI0022B3D71D|nr:response regulator [Cerasicoccus sp. TK19100]
MSDVDPNAKLILIADDDQATRTFLNAAARKLGHRTIQVDNGKDAFDEAKKNRPDLILLDILMPDIDGYTDLRLLRLNWRTRDIPIVVISGYADQADADRCLTAGANFFLPKPATVAQVRTVINKFLSPASAPHAPNQAES